MDEDHKFTSIFGNPEDLVKHLLGHAMDGDLPVEQVTEMIAAMMGDGEHKHNITIPMRVALICQGFESEALGLVKADMFLSRGGVVFNYAVHHGSSWIDEPHMEAAIKKAAITVLRAGNIDATIGPDGAFQTNGMIVDRDIDAAVAEFSAELDRELPTAPKPREGKWW